MAITIGAAQYFNGGGIVGDVDVCWLDDTHVVIAYTDNTNGKGKVICGSVSGTTITWGTLSEFYNDSVLSTAISICKLSSSKFAISWGKPSGGYGSYVTIGTVSGTTITLGSAVSFSTESYTKVHSICSLSDSLIAVSFYSPTALRYKAIVASISETTPTFGTAVEISSQGCTTSGSICSSDSSHFIILYNEGVNDRLYVKACSVSGTTITQGTPQFTAALKLGNDSFERQKSIVCLSPSLFVFVGHEVSTQDGSIWAGTLDGTTVTIGNKYEFTSTTVSYCSIAKLSETSAIIGYTDSNNTNDGYFCSVNVNSGTTVTINGDDIRFDSGQVVYENIAAGSSSIFASAYYDPGQEGGQIVVGNLPPPTTGSSKFFQLF